MTADTSHSIAPPRPPSPFSSSLSRKAFRVYILCSVLLPAPIGKRERERIVERTADEVVLPLLKRAEAVRGNSCFRRRKRLRTGRGEYIHCPKSNSNFRDI